MKIEDYSVDDGSTAGEYTDIERTFHNVADDIGFDGRVVGVHDDGDRLRIDLVVYETDDHPAYDLSVSCDTVSSADDLSDTSVESVARTVMDGVMENRLFWSYSSMLSGTVIPVDSVIRHLPQR